MKHMKQLLFVALAAMFGIQTSQAQEIEYGLFNHVGAGISLGTDGIGFDVAAPITEWAAVRAGLSFFPKIKYDDDAEIRSNSKSFTKKKVNIEGELNVCDFKMLFDFYPIKNSGFHLTAGAFIGSKKLVKAYNTEEFLARDEWGVSGIMIGNYRVTSDKNGNCQANIEVAGFKPYVGIGFGRAIPKSRINVSCDLGVKFWGKPCVGAVTTTDFGEKKYTKIHYKDLTKEDDEDLRDGLKTAEKITLFPVLNIRLTGRIF
jgi:hypothetical protein